MEHINLYSVGKYHKNFGWEKIKKIKKYFTECPRMALDKVWIAECRA
jgi:hypothetical protein